MVPPQPIPQQQPQQAGFFTPMPPNAPKKAKATRKLFEIEQDTANPYDSPSSVAFDNHSISRKLFDDPDESPHLKRKRESPQPLFPASPSTQNIMHQFEEPAFKKRKL